MAHAGMAPALVFEANQFPRAGGILIAVNFEAASGGSLITV
jgi:hypothetical protein